MAYVHVCQYCSTCSCKPAHVNKPKYAPCPDYHATIVSGKCITSYLCASQLKIIDFCSLTILNLMANLQRLFAQCEFCAFLASPCLTINQ